MLHRIVALCLCLTIVLSPLLSQAVEYRTVERGDTYFVDELFENKLVLVLGKEGGRVKVLHVDGGVDWVAPERLMTRSESSLNDGVEQAAGVGLLLVGLVCLANPAVCTDSAPQ